MTKKKTMTAAVIVYALLLYITWALTELVLVPAVNSAVTDEYARELIRDCVLKNIIWTLPAFLLIRRFSKELYISKKELFGMNKTGLKLLLISVPLAVFVLSGVIVRTHTVAISPSFHPSEFISLLFVGITEEFVFRGLFLNYSLSLAKKNIHRYIAFGINALMFLMIHFPIWISEGIFVSSFTGFGFVTVMALGVLFGWTVTKSRSIWPAVILHSFYDLIVFLFV